MSVLTVDVAERGQVTLPKRLRDRYGIRPGQQYTVIDVGGVLILYPRPSRVDAGLDHIRDELLKEGVTVEEMMTELRRRREATRSPGVGHGAPSPGAE